MIRKLIDVNQDYYEINLIGLVGVTDDGWTKRPDTPGAKACWYFTISPTKDHYCCWVPIPFLLDDRGIMYIDDAEFHMGMVVPVKRKSKFEAYKKAEEMQPNNDAIEKECMSLIEVAMK